MSTQPYPEVCREWVYSKHDKCNAPAQFILWGRLFPTTALGPRCYDHAVRHTSNDMPYDITQWAVYDLRISTKPEQGAVEPVDKFGRMENLGDIHRVLTAMVNRGMHPGSLDWVLHHQVDWGDEGHVEGNHP